ncbi:hypothetical protein ACO3VM_07285 [Methanocaldococcus sp. 10A]
MSKGKCYICGKIIDKKGAVKHLKSCVKKENIKKDVDVFHIGLYAGDYWLHIEIPKDYTLKDLDQFIRDIWVECCEHLSEFTIGNVRYVSLEEDRCNPLPDIIEKEMRVLAKITDEDLEELDNLISSVKSDRLRALLNELKRDIELSKMLAGILVIPKERPMEGVKLEDVLNVGDKFSYTYDFGSSTEIDLKVIDERKGIGFRILARNLPIEFKCKICGKKAEWIYPMNFDTYCDECAKKYAKKKGYDEADELFLPIVNSPRCGVCEYEGSEKYGDI